MGFPKYLEFCDIEEIDLNEKTGNGSRKVLGKWIYNVILLRLVAFLTNNCTLKFYKLFIIFIELCLSLVPKKYSAF